MRRRRVQRANASARRAVACSGASAPRDARLFEPGIAHRLQRGDVRRGTGQFDLRAQLRGDFLLHRHLVLVEQALVGADRSEEHTSELQSLMRISYAVFCLKKKKTMSKQ